MYRNSIAILVFLCAYMAPTLVRSQMQCSGGPVLWDLINPMDNVAASAPLMGNDCPLPTSLDPNIFYCPPDKTQVRPWDSTGNLVVNGPGNGWALDQLYAFGCNTGGWCPYACKAGYIESQFDNSVGQPWAWQSSCNGENVFVGAGRRTVSCADELVNLAPCAGGQQGLYCDTDNIAKVRAPSSYSNLAYTTPCIASAPGTEVINLTPVETTACRTIFPGSEIPQIPTTTLAGQTLPLTVPPVFNAAGETAWWTAGRGNTAGLQHYFMTPVLDSNHRCLTPTCQWITTRPATGNPSVGGIDYSPYILEVSPSSVSNGYNIAVRINCDSSLGDPEICAGNSYDTSLGNPGYGLRIYDVNGNLACDAFWTGPPVTPDCSTICRGDRCANAACSGATCAMAQPTCGGAVQCAATPVQPHINNGNGQPFATGTGFIQACSVSYSVTANAGQSIKIELYPTINITAPGSGSQVVVPIVPPPVVTTPPTSAPTSAATSPPTAAPTAAHTTTPTATQPSTPTATQTTTPTATQTTTPTATHTTAPTATQTSTPAATTKPTSKPTSSSTSTKATSGAASSTPHAGTSTTGAAVVSSICGSLPGCVSSAGVTTCYSPSQYTCSNGVLCPAGFSACGMACYLPTQYACNSGALGPL